MLTAIYSILHMLVDGMCALAMFDSFVYERNGYFNLLIYNFCAFGLQMPIGAVLDLITQRQQEDKSAKLADMPFLFTAIGIVLTILGAFTHPAILGVGNAFFHVGGGVGTIREDFRHNWKGRALGIFVAPGAFGLYVGTLLGKQSVGTILQICYAAAGAAMILLLGILAVVCQKKKDKAMAIVGNSYEQSEEQRFGRQEVIFVLCCFIVVVIRAHVGLSIAFPWKTTLLLGTVSIFAVVFGKMAGGFLAARFGEFKVVTASLLAATAFYLFSNQALPGIAALFCFNMTMPITLYLLVKRYRKLPGFCFGLLTFALFLGYLPAYFKASAMVSENVAGAGFSLISMLLLVAAILAIRKQKNCVQI